jgi:peptidoglycan hydrolase-like protein with peptidoglycan-binding domain
MNSSQPEKTTLAPGFVFKRTLKIGSIGADVRALQQFLNVRGFTVAKKGAGSPGFESIYFGPATAKALAQFQEAHAESILKPFNLKKGTGIFGDMTRRLVNSP